MLLFKIYLFITCVKVQENSIKINKLKILAPAWNDKFELSRGSYSVPYIQDYIKYIIKNMKNLQKIFLLFMFTSIEVLID